MAHDVITDHAADCRHKDGDAVEWNEWNRVYQCHGCGAIEHVDEEEGPRRDVTGTGVSTPETDALRQCRCVWDGERCPNRSTQEDGLCDWCGSRRPEQLAESPQAVFWTAAEFLGLGGAGERHVNPDARPDACWMSDSGRTLA